MQHPSEANTFQKQREDKDYLYINIWLLLAVIGSLLAFVLNIFFQSFDTDTFFMFALVAIFLMSGSAFCVRLSMKKSARPTRLVGLFSFFFTLLTVSLGVLSV